MARITRAHTRQGPGCLASRAKFPAAWQRLGVQASREAAAVTQAAGITPAGGVLGQSRKLNGDLDIQGNILTMGSWVTSGTEAQNALAFHYTDAQNGNASMLRMGGTRGALDWLWSEATLDNTNPQVSMMELTPSHRLILNDTTSRNAPGVTLDPEPPFDSRTRS